MTLHDSAVLTSLGMLQAVHVLPAQAPNPNADGLSAKQMDRAAAPVPGNGVSPPQRGRISCEDTACKVLVAARH